MDDQSYQKLVIRPAVSRQPDQQPEKKYWRRFAAPVTTQQVPVFRSDQSPGRYNPADPESGMQIGIPTHVSFSPVAPHDYAVTSSTRVRPCFS